MTADFILGPSGSQMKARVSDEKTELGVKQEAEMSHLSEHASRV